MMCIDTVGGQNVLCWAIVSPAVVATLHYNSKSLRLEP